MARTVAVLLMLTVLTACGVDGAPQPPVATGMTLSGTVRVGIASEGS